MESNIYLSVIFHMALMGACYIIVLGLTDCSDIYMSKL